MVNAFPVVFVKFRQVDGQTRPCKLDLSVAMETEVSDLPQNL